MTKEIIYKCDICKDKIRKEDMNESIGLYYIGSNNFERRNLNECNHHLCKYCIKSLKENLKIQEKQNGNEKQRTKISICSDGQHSKK